MPTCPKGHSSEATDYCDVCGVPVDGTGAPSPEPAETTACPVPGEAAQTCPECGTVRTGRFCEVDGYDFVAAELRDPTSSTVDSTVPAAAAPPASADGDSTGGGSGTDGSAAGSAAGDGEPGTSEPATAAASEPATTAASEPATAPAHPHDATAPATDTVPDHAANPATATNPDPATDPGTGADPGTATEPGTGSHPNTATDPGTGSDSSTATDPGAGADPGTEPATGTGTDPDAGTDREEPGAATGDGPVRGTDPGTATDPDAGTGGPSPEGGPGAGAAGTDEAPAPVAARWRVAVQADREYHKRVLAMEGPDADAMVFPQFSPERQFALRGPQVLIGRYSRSRGIDPQIDLTGPPEDPGVSHSHALLVCDADGAWSVVDLDSANGTYLNESEAPIEANTPVALRDGDRIHVGAWTTLRLSAE